MELINGRIVAQLPRETHSSVRVLHLGAASGDHDTQVDYFDAALAACTDTTAEVAMNDAETAHVHKGFVAAEHDRAFRWWLQGGFSSKSSSTNRLGSARGAVRARIAEFRSAICQLRRFFVSECWC